MPREMRHTAGGGCRRQVWRRKTSRGAEDASGGGRHIGRRRRRRKQKQSSRWKGVAEGGSPYTMLPQASEDLLDLLGVSSSVERINDDVVQIDTNTNI